MAIFKLPIEYLDNKKNIHKNIKKNLQLYNNDFQDNFNNYLLNISDLDTISDNSENFLNINNNTLYENLTNPSNIFSKLSSNLLSNYYTTNKKYLYEYQKLLENINTNKFKIHNYNESIEIFNLIHALQTDNGFIEKYQYLDLPFLKELNNNKIFLQLLSIFNLSSPLIGLLLPLIMLFLPFIILIKNFI
jgi:hypothetical protein